MMLEHDLVHDGRVMSSIVSKHGWLQIIPGVMHFAVIFRVVVIRVHHAASHHSLCRPS